MLLVVRGWVAEPAASARRPDRRVDLVGAAAAGDGSTDVDADPGDDVLPALRVPDVLQRLDVDLYGGYVVALPGSPAPSRSARPPLEQLPAPSRFTAVRNLLYALEWWVFGLFAAFIWWRHVRDVASGLDGRAGEPEDADEATLVVGRVETRRTLGAVNGALLRYRVMASIVGVLL